MKKSKHTHVTAQVMKQIIIQYLDARDQFPP